MVDCDCGAQMRLKLANVGEMVIVGEQVYAADLYTCLCGGAKLGSFAREPMPTAAADWPPTWRRQPQQASALERPGNLN